MAELTRKVGERPLRVLVADDHALFRSGVRTALADDPSIEVIGEAEDGEALLEAYERLDPDVLVLDLRMPKHDGCDVVRRLRSTHHDVKAIVLTTYAADGQETRVYEAGAKAFLSKDVHPTDLKECIRTVASGRRWRSAPVEMQRVPIGLLRVSLTPQERCVLLLVAAGKSNKEIARQLGIVEGTVKQHVSRVLEKLNVDSRTQAVAKAVRLGMIEL